MATPNQHTATTLPIHGAINTAITAQETPSVSQTNNSIPHYNIGAQSSANNPPPSQQHNSLPHQLISNQPSSNNTSNTTTTQPSSCPSNNNTSDNTTPSLYQNLTTTLAKNTTNIKNVPPHIKILNPPPEPKDWNTMTLAERLEATTALPLQGFEEYEWRIQSEEAGMSTWPIRKRGK
ncbi:hypothetical protein KCU81_g3289, partial [Aureobasidium melanogenum]|uniref:Uncharacterized protein n=1 Tax=Aureobasidium melanogenum (strain CBS 110374) TaxID=1043003 RepID=A0A074VML9_AURM1